MFGASFGGMLAYEAARAAEMLGFPRPSGLFVAACAPPNVFSQAVARRYGGHSADKTQLLNRVQALRAQLQSRDPAHSKQSLRSEALQVLLKILMGLPVQGRMCLERLRMCSMRMCVSPMYSTPLERIGGGLRWRIEGGKERCGPGRWKLYVGRVHGREIVYEEG